MRLLTEIMIGTLKENGFEVSNLNIYYVSDSFWVNSHNGRYLRYRTQFWVFDDSIKSTPTMPRRLMRYDIQNPKFDPQKYFERIMLWLRKLVKK